ncbi:MAG TPA: hypothetical protein DCL61_06685 [Cyanobacteria bacterium UBA12227]|nr:hypothetical protein [Cyanobacteria bacterium UBA12227]HAX87454.1 hypothetical protein [Cyanobacteria bacterium UBA11370]
MPILNPLMLKNTTWWHGFYLLILFIIIFLIPCHIFTSIVFIVLKSTLEGTVNWLVYTSY